MLTRDRHELAPKAVACFLRQTYPNKSLLIYDTGKQPLAVNHNDLGLVAHAMDPEKRELPIGSLRNNANRMVNADVIIHWDDDDWSHPQRIAEQVATLTAGHGVDAVGYNEMLFWREPYTVRHPSKMSAAALESGAEYELFEGAAWLYSHARADYALGTSLCYWRKTWETKQFRDDLPKKAGFPYDGTGEDHDWIQGLQIVSHRSVTLQAGASVEPRMIARIHGANSSGQYANLEKSTSWKRVEWMDQKVREWLGQ